MSGWKDNMPGELPEVPQQRFLVIGCGSIGQRHLKNLKRLGVRRLSAVDPRPDRQGVVCQRFRVPCLGDLAEALNQGIQVALICTPTSLHLQHALLAARAGCHLFIEKPLAHCLEGVDELLAEIAARRLASLVGCNFRFHPGLGQVKALLAEGAVGAVVSARAQFGHYLPDWHPWEDYRLGYSARQDLGGGVVLDRIHELDYLCWLLGEVVEVGAFMGRLSDLEIDTEDTAEILLRFASGTLGSLHLDYVRRTYGCSLEITGTEGTIRWSYARHSVSWYRAGENRWQSLKWPNYQADEMYQAQMRHFLQVVQGREPAALDAAQARRVLVVALAAKQAAAQGKVVQI